MEGEVRYCKTEDGVGIAYRVSGNGPALLAMPSIVESFSLTHQVRDYTDFHARLSHGYRRIDYDRGGVGLSQRDVTDVSLDALVGCMEAVVRASSVKRLSIWADGHNGPPAPSSLRSSDAP